MDDMGDVFDHDADDGDGEERVKLTQARMAGMQIRRLRAGLKMCLGRLHSRHIQGYMTAEQYRIACRAAVRDYRGKADNYVQMIVDSELRDTPMHQTSTD